MRLGVIGDDFTGSSDIALMLAGARGEGLATVQYVGVPCGPAGQDADAPDADAGDIEARDVEAGVVALKSRSVPVADAVAQSLAALEWLRAQGAQTILFKVCSTFDSTPEGNIGPVAEALADALARATGRDDPVIVCPAFPATGRTVYRGHLFVGDRLLSESGLESHPLNPMTDPDLVRWLGRQTAGAVGRVGFDVVAGGADAVREALIAERDAGRRLVVCDAVRDDDLRVLGRAMVEGGFPLAVCGSGLALGLPALLGAGASGSDAFGSGTSGASASGASASGSGGPGSGWSGIEGPAVALSGSCSGATRAQLAAHEAAGHPVRRLDADAIVGGIARPDELADWALGRAGEGLVPVLATSDDPDAVRAVQERHGRERSAAAIEAMHGALALALVSRGATRIVAAGGETSGAVVTALGAKALAIGPMIDPGVPALATGHGDARIGLALKSGNFGAPDFFGKAARILADDMPGEAR